MLPELTSNPTKIVIFGLGEIGRVTASALSDLGNLRAYDSDNVVLECAREHLCNVEFLTDIGPEVLDQNEIVIDCTRNAPSGLIPQMVKGRNVRAVVNLSSFAVYGAATSPPNETTLCAPVTPYGEAKVEQEAAAQAISGESLLGTISLRLPGFVSRKLSPNSSRSTKYVHEAILEMAMNDAPTPAVNLGEYIHQDRYASLIRATIERIAKMPLGQNLPTALNVCGGQMLTHEHAWAMFSTATWRGDTSLVSPSPSPQMPLMDCHKLREFLGAKTYAETVKETPVSAFWNDLVPSVLTSKVAA